MALAAMLSCQAYISLMDQVDHAHHHAHFANPLAGAVTYTVADQNSSGHHHHHDGTHDSADHHHGAADTSGDQHSHGPADHQHGDAAIVFLAAQSFVLVGCPLAASPCESRPQDFISFSPRGPDHPPKSDLEIRV
jgi:hypothetical protein